MIMDSKADFTKWLQEYTELSQSSISKYVGAINTISNELKEADIINSNLYMIKSSQISGS